VHGGSRIALSGLLAVSLALMLLVSALVGLRSPSATAEVGAVLAADATVRGAVVDLATDAALDALADGAVPLGPLLPLLRPVLTEVLAQVLDSEPGRAILSRALADLVRQASFGPPLVLDLRTALAVGLEYAPPQLGDISDLLLFDDAAGLLVIDGDGIGPGDPREVAALRATRTSGTVGGLPDRWTLRLLAVVVTLLSVALVLLGRGGPRRSAAPAGVLLSVALPVALLLTFASTMITQAIGRIGAFATADTTDTALWDALLPLLSEQFATLLGPTRLLATAIAGGALVALTVVHVGRRADD
jgi:hypothetical protein